MRNAPHRIGLAALVALLAGGPARALIFFSTGDPAFNTRPPTGKLADCGWQWVGTWGGFQGTAIGPHQFIAARHTGGLVGDAFMLNGVKFTVSAFFDDTGDDLRICMVHGTFRSWAPLYRGRNEAGKVLVVIGRGLGRGPRVELGGRLNGWQWGGGRGPMRWGQSRVAAVVDGGPVWGSLLLALFEPSDNPNEADVATGDSGGPVFVRNGGRWELAGVAAAADGPFSRTGADGGFQAAIFDGRGLYSRDNEGHWRKIEGADRVPTGFYATRVSTRVAWIDSVLREPYRPTIQVLLPRPGRPQ
jgi:hypothetical protein